ncbi:MAG: TldD/PmbA family protein [Pseudanabaena sp.]|jgi:predicted Zn-dependent protease|nr:TldD/PmbA family protein [Pseudanabaena sp. M090S1SP2A07QC]MCA6506948.1 TldD/PmbA family protein [Pseudanabaena sp. M172S2SP2A07QC]MCA6519515.1 TldD/PmbA family protein [Pseudanabaena sp. M110S1SP2A07QC]MCA6522372.1 TldD/PmbA family protein [Pseudanabaena sp. M051S1SP2A07QC]MCA6526551.1 TldD/PmbA family protein [Pseudanabaena sp. M179S2SP2A07QC]MCA6532298.1 TldD/PmbA family protein [Pseudanabaena sp. M125S2SP2A07QC]MCA6536116.1 TldD/PmbA family protein [Pseudanabaena sp. M176S2SP2A07QC]MC
MQFDLKAVLSHIDLPFAEWIGLREVKEINTTRYVRDRKPQSNGRSQSHGVMIEVLADGQFGYASTNHLDLANIQLTAQKAYQQAKISAQWAVHHFTIAQRPRAIGQYFSPFLKPSDAITPKEINELLIEICKTLKVSDQIVKTSAYAVITEIETKFASSNGSDIYQKFLTIATDYAATAQDGTIIQKRGDNGQLARCNQIGMEVFDREAILQRAQVVGEQAVELLTAVECPTETTALVLAPDQMLLQIHESIGHPLEIDRILGDERNYAGGSFIKLEDFGNMQYGSSLMNVSFDPTMAGEFASYAFDDAGIPATKEYLIKEGKLLRGLGSSESQVRSGIAGVANARATSWNRPAIDRMANINLESGEYAFQEMIADIERGVYMESNRSWSIDDYRNKFQFGCEYAKLIENGKLTKTLRNPNYRGITNQFWNSLAKVGNHHTVEAYGSPFCGKGEPNQVIRVGHASPICLFTNIEVFGGAN